LATLNREGKRLPLNLYNGDLLQLIWKITFIQVYLIELRHPFMTELQGTHIRVYAETSNWRFFPEFEPGILSLKSDLNFEFEKKILKFKLKLSEFEV